MVRKSDAHSSFRRNCHHHILFSNFKLKVYYPIADEKLVKDMPKKQTLF